MYAHTQYHLRWMILVSSTVYKESLVAGMIVTQYAPCQILSQALQGCFWSCLWLMTTSPPTKQKRSVTKLHTMYTQWDWIFVDELTSLIFSKKGTPNTLWAAWRLEWKGWEKGELRERMEQDRQRKREWGRREEIMQKNRSPLYRRTYHSPFGNVLLGSELHSHPVPTLHSVLPITGEENRVKLYWMHCIIVTAAWSPLSCIASVGRDQWQACLWGVHPQCDGSSPPVICRKNGLLLPCYIVTDDLASFPG